MPDGVTLQGWDPTEQPPGKAFTVIHHPNGDYKRIAFGKVTGNALPSAIESPNMYAVQYTQGITEHGSSGSGMFSAPGVLVGDLSTGSIADTTEGLCRLNPLSGSFGKFSVYYPMLRDALEAQTGSAPANPPPAATGGTNTLTSGVPVTFTLAAVNDGSLVNGKNGFSIDVPQGAVRLDVILRTTTPNADLDLYVRYGQDVAMGANGLVADYVSEGPIGLEFIFIGNASRPALRAGTYYIALGQFTTGIEITGALLATVTTAGGTPPPSSGQPTPLTSGVSQSFTVPAVDDATLFNGNSGFTIDVPQGATRLEVKLASNTKGADLDLYVAYGDDVSVDDEGIIADYGSEGDDANELIVVNAASDPPLKAGTYYIAFVSWNPGIAVDATITATVTTGATPPPPSAGNTLVSGRAQSFAYDPVTGPTIFNGNAGFRIVVPQGATSMDVVLHTATPNADLDLFARYGQDVGINNGNLVTDYGSDGPTGEERITINASSNPPLRPGTYYIDVAVMTAGVPVSGTITATVGAGNNTPPPPPPSGGPTALTSGRPQTLLFNPVSDPTFFNGNKSYVIDVPANSTRLDIQLSSTTPGVDMDLYVSYGKDNGINSQGFIADYASEGPNGNERITITPGSSPALRAGRYYISIALYTTGTNVQGSLVATVTSGGSGQAPAPGGGAIELTAGQATKFSLPAVTDATLFTGDHSFRILAPPGAVVMRIQVASDNPSVNVDPLVRYGADIGVDGKGNLLADYLSNGPTGNETLIVSTNSKPPLNSGPYYISLALLTTGKPSTGTITVTFSNDVLSIPNVVGTMLSSGMPESYHLPAVSAPTLFGGSSAYRISVDKRHKSLRLSLRDNAPGANVALYVRRGRQPEVVNGKIVADYYLPAGSANDLVIEGARLRPGVYYITMGQYSTGAASAGTLTATLTAPDGDAQEFQLAPAFGITIQPKRSVEQRYALPDVPTAPISAGSLTKHSNRLRIGKGMKVEVSR
jgi:pre-peptidase